jgi:hypothetical protein
MPARRDKRFLFGEGCGKGRGQPKDSMLNVVVFFLFLLLILTYDEVSFFCGGGNGGDFFVRNER